MPHRHLSRAAPTQYSSRRRSASLMWHSVRSCPKYYFPSHRSQASYQLGRTRRAYRPTAVMETNTASPFFHHLYNSVRLSRPGSSNRRSNREPLVHAEKRCLDYRSTCYHTNNRKARSRVVPPRSQLGLTSCGQRIF